MEEQLLPPVIEKPKEKLSAGRQAIRRELYEMVMESFESKESQEIVKQTGETTLRTRIRNNDE
jgi:flagellar basal body-associated protein FliL